MFQFFLDADIQIFGGDINATPIDNLHQPYGMLRYTSPVLLLPVIPYCKVYTDNLHQPNGMLRYTFPVFYYLLYRTVQCAQMTSTNPTGC